MLTVSFGAEQVVRSEFYEMFFAPDIRSSDINTMTHMCE